MAMYAIYTTELIESRKRRMPWRTVLEIARYLRAVVFSGDGKAEEEEIEGVRVEYVSKPFDRGSAGELTGRMGVLGVERLYFPVVPGRSYGALQDACDDAGIEIVWYMTSSWNSVWRVIRAWRYMGFRAVRPYLVQALVPKHNWVARLNRRKVRKVITMSPWTGGKLVESGYPASAVNAILPGLDDMSGIPAKKPAAGKYFLFFGPPQKIRGICLILEAARRLAARRSDFKVVMLVRCDENAAEDLAALKKAVGELDIQTARVVDAHYERLAADEINSYIDSAVAVLKPFIFVPSEIPLAPMEAMQRGKVVIGFEGDGTGNLIGSHGIVVRHCDAKALSDAMELTLERETTMCPLEGETWSQVAEKWRCV